MKVTVDGQTRHFRTVTYDASRNAVCLLGQRVLPHQFKVITTKSMPYAGHAITAMVVRGAGAIGATAAYGLAQGAMKFRGNDMRRFMRHIHDAYQTLKRARPTAVDPVNAMGRLVGVMCRGRTVAEKQMLALAAAEEFA